MLILASDFWRPTRQQFWRLLGLAILLLGLFLSLSRAAWLMFAAGSALLLVFYRRTRWHQANWGLFLILAAPFTVFILLSIAPYLPSSWPFVDRLQSFLTLSSDDTFSARLTNWSLAWHDWLQQPMTGWGPGSFADIHGEIRSRPAWIGNLSMRLLQETGIIGVIAFVGFLFTLLIPAIKVSSLQSNALDRAALLGLTIGYVVLLGVAYQSTDGIWLSASWVHAGLIAAGTIILASKKV
jgi:O-antigen ligase